VHATDVLGLVGVRFVERLVLFGAFRSTVVWIMSERLGQKLGADT